MTTTYSEVRAEVADFAISTPCADPLAERPLFECPQCHQVAEVQWCTDRRGTDPAADLVKIICDERHWFLMPRYQLRALDEEALRGRRHDTAGLRPRA
jgi:hypothetical protein